MARIHDTGRQGEDLARNYLIGQGYRIIETNWRSNHHELDIVASKDQYIVFAEVKTRNNSYYGPPEAFVGKEKQRRLIKAANHYLLLHNIQLEARFDVIAITQSMPTPRIDHIADAFYPECNKR